MSERNWFKATSPANRSGDILVSFDAKWLQVFTQGSVESIVRRRYPKSFAPRRMYLYIGSPHSCLIGFVNINGLRSIAPQDAEQIISSTNLTTNELNSYFAGYERIGCYAVSPVALFRSALSLDTLRVASGFSPPQSFVALSRRASDWLAQQELVGPPRDRRKERTSSKVTGQQR
jgi:predicted transcriptional regulator